MKYHCETTIDLPRDQVVELLDDIDNLRDWQPDLLRINLVAGIPGQPQARLGLVYRSAVGEIEIVQTVTERKLPDEFSYTLETPAGINTVKNQYRSENGSTRWLIDAEFIATGLLKAVTWVAGATARKQTARLMHDFKSYAERKKA